MGMEGRRKKRGGGKDKRVCDWEVLWFIQAAGALAAKH